MRRDSPRVGDPKCLVIAVYFGELPSYFTMFSLSIRHNPDVDFLLVTDQSVESPPPNLTVSTMSLGSFKSKVEAALGMSVSMARGYKVCDFRPAFGMIFADEIRSYSHWGHCDLDVIFGDILGVLPIEAFSYPKILIRGCFALYENTPEACSWFRTVVPGADYRRAFALPNPFHFDEAGGIYKILRYRNVPIWNNECIFNIAWESFRMRAIDSPPGYHLYTWKNGRVFEWSRDASGALVSREALLIHLMKRPMMRPTFNVEEAEQIAIGPDNFTCLKGDEVMEALDARPSYWWRREVSHRVLRLRRRLKRRGTLRPLT